MVGHRGLAGRLKNLQHRGIAPSWSCKSPQTHQGFRLQRFGLRSSLSAPAQDKTITPKEPVAQHFGTEGDSRNYSQVSKSKL